MLPNMMLAELTRTDRRGCRFGLVWMGGPQVDPPSPASRLSPQNAMRELKHYRNLQMSFHVESLRSVHMAPYLWQDRGCST
jgi:hypothetical protein